MIAMLLILFGYESGGDFSSLTSGCFICSNRFCHDQQNEGVTA